jgi:hypothetical protein
MQLLAHQTLKFFTPYLEIPYEDTYKTLLPTDNVLNDQIYFENFSHSFKYYDF